MQNDNGINGNHYLIDPPTKFRDELNGAFPTSEGSEVCDLIITHYVWLLTNDDVDHMPDQFDELSQVIAAYRLPWPVAEMLCAVYRIGKKGTEVRAWNKVLKFCAIQLRNIHGRAKEADEKLFFDVMRVAHFRLRDMGEIPVLTYGGNGDKLAALKAKYIKHGFFTNSPVVKSY